MDPALKKTLIPVISAVFLLAAACPPDRALSAQEKLPLKSIERTTADIQFQYKPLDFAFKESRVISIREIAAESASTSDSEYQLIISSNTSDIRVRINRATYSGSPVKISGLTEGEQFLVISQDGYKPLRLTTSVRKGMQYQISVELALYNGTMTVNADLDPEILQIDGDTVQSGQPVSLGVGQHRVVVRRFGYLDYDQSISVRESTETRVDVHFAAAPFRIYDAGASRARFRPGNLGSLGTSTLGFEASNAGTGRLTIRDSQGTLVRTHDFPAFTTWTQSFVWDGRDEQGNLLPDGSYDWNVQAAAAGDADGQTIELKGQVAIDSSSFIKFRSIAAGPAGLPLVSDAYTLPAGSFEAITHFNYLPAGIASGTGSAAEFAIGFRIGIIKDLEFSLNGLGQIPFVKDSVLTTLVGGNLSWSFLPLSGDPAKGGADALQLGLSLNLGGALPLSDSGSYPYNAWATGIVPGGRLGLAAQLRLGMISLLLEPVVYLSPWQPVISEIADASKPGKLPSARACFFGSLNGGLYLDLEWLLVGASTALRTDVGFLVSPHVPLSAYVQAVLTDGIVLGLSADWLLGANLSAMPQLGVSVGLVN